MLKHFRVLSRDQIGSLICPEVSRPFVTVNRVMKRLSRDGYILQVPQVKDRPYLYMPNPTIIHPQSNKINHFLGLVDIYISLNQPKIFEVEPIVNDEYRPDAYVRLDGDTPVLIELQRTAISTKRMQEKVDAFAKAHMKKEHDAKTLWIVADTEYRVKIPSGFDIVHKKISAVI